MKTVMITGVTGFIGGALARSLLRDGVAVHALVRPGADRSLLPAGVCAQVHPGSSVELARLLSTVAPDAIVHLASLFLAEHEPGQVDELIASNVLFGTQLLEAMALSGVTRFVNTGTSWQHWATPGYRPVNLYAATKQAFEDILAYYRVARGISCVTLKLYDTYGPGDRRRKLVNVLLDAAGSGAVLEMSPGEQVLDLCYIDDVVAAFRRALEGLQDKEAPLSGDFLVSGSRHTLREVVAIVDHACGGGLRVNFGGRPYRPREVMLPVPAGSRALPGWSPAHDLAAGLALLLAARRSPGGAA